MRILMLSQFYPPIIGGEENHVRNLSNELVKRGHEVAVATLGRPGLADFELDGDVRVYRIRSTTQRAKWLYSESERRHVPPFPDPEALWALRDVTARERPEIVHAHNWLLHSFLPLKAWSKAPLVVTLHDYSLRCATKRFMHHGTPCSGPGLIKCIVCAADHYGSVKGSLTVLSNWLMSMLERSAVDMFLPVSYATATNNGLIGSRIPFEVISNFVPDDIGARRNGTDHRLAQLPSESYLLFVGDISRDKGANVLLQAYANLANVPPLVLIGRSCMDISTPLPPNVILLNNWPHSAVMEAWHRSLLALVPSTWPEPCGTVALEAMVTGRAVIASRIGGLAEILIDGETGILVPPGDSGALGQAITHLLERATLRERMGQAGKRRVVEFLASSIVPKIESVYRNLAYGNE